MSSSVQVEVGLECKSVAGVRDAREDFAPVQRSPAPVLRVRDVGKCYHIYDRPQDRLKQALFRWRRTYYREFWAVRDISFEVARGEAVGILGRNGSGKSTLLQLIAGTLAPTTGTVEVAGRVAALLELGSGFNPEFSGRENVYLNGAILGLTRAQIDERFDRIASFADIGQFMDQPVKTYSSGMMVRLAFAVQVQLDPDILIVDEALAVGDALFQKRCYQRIDELRASGVTLLFVSHDQEAVRTLTDRAILLEGGEVRASGSSGHVLLEYRKLLHEQEKFWTARQLGQSTSSHAIAPAGTRQANASARDLSFGDLDACIERVEVLDAHDQPCSVFYPGDTIRIAVTARAMKTIRHLNIAFRLRNKQGFKITSWGVLNDDIARWSRGGSDAFWEREVPAGATVRAVFECECALGPNLYEVQATVTQELDRYYRAQRILHWRDEAAFFQVAQRLQEYNFGGMIDLKMRTSVECSHAVGDVS